MTKKATMAINSKHLLKSSQTPKAYDFETRHGASGNGAQHRSPLHLNGYVFKMSFEGKNLKEMGKWTENLS